MQKVDMLRKVDGKGESEKGRNGSIDQWHERMAMSHRITPTATKKFSILNNRLWGRCIP